MPGTLYTYGARITNIGAYFESFDTIAYSPTAPAARVELRLSEAGTANVATQLGTRPVSFTGSSGNDVIVSGDGNDRLVGGLGSDTLIGNGGDDEISDSGVAGATTDIQAGSGNDTITLGTKLNGRVDGGSGMDRLIYDGDFGSTLVISDVETLYASGVGGTAEQFESFDTIAYSTSNASSSVNLKLLQAGNVDLADELLGRAVQFTGSTGDDGIRTSNGNDWIRSQSGNDTVNSGSGNDSVFGVEGNDTLNGEAGDDTIYGGIGNDTLSGGDGNDVLNADDERQIDMSTTDVLDGGDGNDDLTDRGGATTILGGSGSDRIHIASGMAGSIDGGTGVDVLDMTIPSGDVGTLGSLAIKDVEYFDVGNNRILGTGDQLESFSTIRQSAAGSRLSVRLGLSGAGSVDLTTQLRGRAVDFIGSSGNDTITTSNGNDTIDGSEGNDALAGGDGNDRIIDKAGDTTAILGGSGDDTIELSGGFSGSVDGGTGTDIMIATAADTLGELAISNVERLYTSGFNVVGSAAQFESFSTIARTSGSLGTTVYLTLSGPGVVDLAGELTGRNAVFTGSNRDDVITTSDGDDVIDGGYGIDKLSGGDGDDSLNGGDGADTLQGGNGKDFLSGDAGNDLLAGGAGGDQLVGGDGVDTASYLSSSTAVRVSLLTFSASGGDAEGDALSLIESLRGSEFDDMLSGDDGVNTLDGRGGNDRLLGRAGADVLIGGDGIDEAVYLASSAAVTVSLATGKGAGGDAEGDTLSTIENVSGSRYSDVLTGSSGANMLSGDNGNDRLSSGLGMDVLTGGEGSDTFVFNTAVGATNIDTITDFTVGLDAIQLAKSIYSALQNGAAPNSLSASSFRYDTAPSASGGLGEIIYNASTGSLSYDSDGAGVMAARQIAQVSAGLALSSADFRLV